MSGPLHATMARELSRATAADLVDRADRYRRRLAAAPTRPTPARRLRQVIGARLVRRRTFAPANPAAVELRIRYALADDAPALRRLAALDASTVPEPPLLVAEVRGEIHAAFSLWDARAIADPFERTQALVELLTVRAAQLESAAAALADAPLRAPAWSSAASSHGR